MVLLWPVFQVTRLIIGGRDAVEKAVDKVSRTGAVKLGAADDLGLQACEPDTDPLHSMCN